MKVIQPVTVTPAMLTSSNVTEPDTDYPAWNSATAYSVNAKVGYNHRNWIAAVANTNVAPGTVTTPATWTDQGANNRWKMFDDVIGSQSIRTGTIVVTVTPGQVVNSVALFNLSGRTVRVTMTDPVDGVVYDRTVQLVDAGVSNWYDYFFAPIGANTDLVLTDLPTYGSASITLTVDAGLGTAAVGSFILGTVIELGCTQWGATGGITDFSRKVRDDFGNFTIVERSYAKERSFNVIVETSQMAMLERTLASLRAKPVVWIGDDDYEFTLVVGFFRDFTFVLQYKNKSQLSINIEGVI